MEKVDVQRKHQERRKNWIFSLREDVTEERVVVEENMQTIMYNSVVVGAVNVAIMVFVVGKSTVLTSVL